MIILYKNKESQQKVLKCFSILYFTALLIVVNLTSLLFLPRQSQNVSLTETNVYTTINVIVRNIESAVFLIIFIFFIIPFSLLANSCYTIAFKQFILLKAIIVIYKEYFLNH